MLTTPKLEVFKSFTLSLANLSKCSERKVAAIIVDSNLTQVHSIGINGGPVNQWQCLCELHGKYGCVHAEINCLVKNTYHAKDKRMLVTLAPCKQCAAAIINTPGSFECLYYFEEWKETTGLKMLQMAGIHTVKI